MLRQVFDGMPEGRTRNERIGGGGGLRKTTTCFYPEGRVLRCAPRRGGGFYRPQWRGQSTTLKSILGLVHPDGGDVRFFGQDVRQHERKFKEQIGVVLGGIDFYPKKKVKTITDVTRRFYRNWDGRNTATI